MAIKRYRKIVNVLGWVVLIAMFVYVAMIWNSLPDQIPMHYNLQGEIDSYGGPAFILIMPIVMSLLFIMIAVIEHHPGIWNIPVEVCESAKEKIYESMALTLVTIRFLLILFAGIETYLSVNGRNIPVILNVLFMGGVIMLPIIDMIYIVKINKKGRELQ